MFHYLNFNGLKFQHGSICPVLQLTILLLSCGLGNHRGGGVVGYFSQFRREATTKRNTLHSNFQRVILTPLVELN